MRLARLIGSTDRSLVAEAHYGYGYALEQLGEVEQAVAAYETALLHHQRHAKARRALHRLCR